VTTFRQQIENLASRPVVKRPLEVVHHQQSEVDRLAQQLASALPGRLNQTRHVINQHRARIYQSTNAILPLARLRLSELSEHTSIREPNKIIETRHEQLIKLALRLDGTRLGLMRDLKSRLETETARLNAFNPLAVLSRGFSLTTNLKNVPITDCQNVAVGDKIQTELDRGRLVSRIEEIKSK